MSSKFKVGDRVAVYESRWRKVGAICNIRDNILEVETPDSIEYVHFKQCRLLKKKERRRIWVNKTWLNEFKEFTYNSSDGWSLLIASNPPGSEFTEFIEVKKK